jgi:L-iditol 2-dehydrogenase
VRDGDHVLVIGLGVMGLLHLLVMRALAAPAQLLAADRIPERLARGPGVADAVIDVSRVNVVDAVAEATGGRGADVVVVGPGSVDALEAGRQATAPGGTLVVFTPAPPDAVWPLRVHDVFFNETTIVPSYSAGPTDTREAMRLLSGGLAVEPLITHRLPLRDAGVGYTIVRAMRGGAAVAWPVNSSKGVTQPGIVLSYSMLP